MSVLINIERPTSCSVCPMLEGDRMNGLCHAASKWLDDDEHWTWYVYPEGDVDDSKPCNCPLVSIPPHGLIDRERILDSIRIELAQANAVNDMEDYDSWMRGFDYVRKFPTTIPAEEGEP